MLISVTLDSGAHSMIHTLDDRSRFMIRCRLNQESCWSQARYTCLGPLSGGDEKERPPKDMCCHVALESPRTGERRSSQSQVILQVCFCAVHLELQDFGSLASSSIQAAHDVYVKSIKLSCGAQERQNRDPTSGWVMSA